MVRFGFGLALAIGSRLFHQQNFLSVSAYISRSATVSRSHQHWTSKAHAAVTKCNEASDVIEIGGGEVDARTARISAPLLIGISSLLWSEPANAGIGATVPFDESRKRYFPGSIQSSVVALRVDSTLRSRFYLPKNTVLGASLCSEGMDSLASTLASTLSKRRLVNLGGSSGLPFAANSGLEALVSSCPKSGKIIVLFGPHVGISKEGEVGKVERVGEDGARPSCGSVLEAYKATSASLEPEAKETIGKAKGRLAELAMKAEGADDATVASMTRQIYPIVRDQLQQEINALTSKEGFWEHVSEITLLGGVMINRAKGGKGGEDCFQPFMIKSISAKGETDLYERVFGDLPVPSNDRD